MKRFSLLIGTMLCCIYSYGQLWDNSKPDKSVTFGVRVGVNNSRINHNGTDKWGFHAGGNLDYNIVKSFALETGVFYTEKGCKKAAHRDTEIENMTISCLQIPLLAVWKLPLNQDFHVQLKAGPYFDYYISVPESIGYDRKAVGFGALFGIGATIKRLYIGVQYEQGITAVTGSNYNSNLAISLGYDF